MGSSLTNAQGIVNYLLSQPFPSTYTTPRTVKDLYADVLRAQSAYTPQLNEQLRRYGAYTPTADSKAYRKLVQLYEGEYQSAAKAAAREAASASAAAAGGADSYSDAAAKATYSAVLAGKGAAVPALLKAAAKAGEEEKKATAAGVAAMREQQAQKNDTAQKLYNAAFSELKQMLKAKQTADTSRRKALAAAYTKLKK